MFRGLRNRLVLSHILPLLLIVPSMGITLVYVLETQVLLPSLERELTGDALLLTEAIRQRPEVWEDPRYALNILEHVDLDPAKRVMLLKPDGRLTVSTDPLDQDRLNKKQNIPRLVEAQSGQVVTQTDYSQRLHGEVIDVLAPVIGPGQQVIGIVRLTYRYATVFEELLRLRYLIAAILLLGLISGTIIGSILALNISIPVQRVSQAIYNLAQEDRREPLPEQGPEEIKRLARTVNFLVERLNNLEEARRHLLANLVHELGRPLGALRSGVQALTRGAKQDPHLLDEMLEGMDGEIVLLQRLLDDLAHLYDKVLGTLELDRQSILLSEWLVTMLRPWEEAARKKRLHWETSIPENLRVVKADPVRLAQIVGNLVSNAIKYTSTGDTVSVSAGEDERGEVWVRVSDTGPGISPEEQEKIFEPFYRGKQGRRIKQGMGLGLSIARDLILAHEGRLEIDSAPGLGSHFTFWIPRNRRIPERT